MRVFVISMKRSLARRATVAAQLRRLGLPFEFIDAVDGSGLSPDELRTLVDPEAVKIRPDLQRPGVVGCALSHRLAYRRMVEEAVPCALILEDDVTISEALLAALPFLEEALGPDEVQLLFFQANEPITLKRGDRMALPGGGNLHWVESYSFLGSALGYVVPLEAARKLIEVQTPIRYVADEWPRFREDGAVARYRMTYPFLVDHGAHNSEIGYAPRSARKLLGMLQRFIPLLDGVRHRRHQRLLAQRQIVGFED